VKALASGEVSEIPTGPWRPEVRYGAHRFDFGIASTNRGRWSALLELKSSNLRVGRTALFPDAPTVRGRRHLDALAEFARRGGRADIVFAVQRDDVDRFRPNDALDPEFARAMTRATAAGVRSHAFTIRVRPARASLGRRIPVVLPGRGALAPHQPI
jgi:sugar fermentation stimulation protein A